MPFGTFNPADGWQFSTSQNPGTDDCGCHNPGYCKVYSEEDTITLQLPADTTQSTFLDGCPALTDACYVAFTLDIFGTKDPDFDRVCWGDNSAVGTTPIIYKSFGFTSGNVYLLKVTVSNYEGGEWFAFINSTANASGTFSTGGTFYINLTSVATATGNWGIGVPGSTAPNFCIDSLELYEFCGVTAVLIDGSGNNVGGSSTVYEDSGIVKITWNPAETTMEDGGCYQIKLFDCDNTTYYSNCIKYIEEADCKFLQLKYRNNSNAFGFDYSNANTYNFLRVQGRLKHPTWPVEKTDYTSSIGTTQINFARLGKEYTLALNDLPDYMHEAIAAALCHDTLLIDGVEYTTGEMSEYAPQWRKSSELAPVEVRMRVKVYDMQMGNC